MVCKCELSELPYEYGALEPHIDAQTMEIHYSKHHSGYVSKLKAALEAYPDLIGKDVNLILQDVESVPEKIRSSVINNGGGHSNHSLFWEIMTPDQDKKKFGGSVAAAINEEFGDFDSFKEKFSEAAKGRFGSGWAWLVVNPKNENKLEVLSTPNQDSPFMEGKFPIIGLDVWEHAYYLKYQNKRPDYVTAFWNVVNWEKVNELYEEAKK